MAQRDRSDITSALSSKGFTAKGGDHTFFIYHSIDGKKTTIKTKISRGSVYKVYSDPLLAAMARQCKLTKQNLLKFIDCSISQQKYEEILSKQNPNPLI